MGCLTSSLHRIGGITSSLSRESGGISSVFTRFGGITSSLERIGGISSSLKKRSGISCRMGLVCRPNIGKLYLEIEPKIIWVYPDWSAYNDVYSNTFWNVN